MARFTNEDIRRHVGEPAFGQGRDYERAGRVTLIKVRDTLVHAEVQGSDWQPYPVTLRLGRNGGRLAVDARCGCPAGLGCKHVAAVLLAVLEGDGTAVAAPPRKSRGRPVPRLLLRQHKVKLSAHYARHGAGRDRADADGYVAMAAARLSYLYDGMDVDGPGTVVTRVRDGRTVEIRRDTEAERQARSRLYALGFARIGNDYRFDAPMHLADDLILSLDAEPWLDFLRRDLGELAALGWMIEEAADFAFRMAQFSGHIEATVKAAEAGRIDWFELALGTLVDGQRIDLLPALLGFLHSHPLGIPRIAEADPERLGALHVRLADGRLLPLPLARIRPILAALADLIADAPPPAGGKIRLSRAALAAATTLEDATAAAGVRWQGAEALRALGRRLQDNTGQVAIPALFHGSLRPYQHRGVDWMQLLREVGLGGILADDMGLGKTVQTLAHIAIEKQAGRLDRPCLVVAPTSLMANWRLEAEAFIPSLRVLVLHGTDRKDSFSAVDEHDLVLTTYPLLARDAEVLAARPWHLVILDEAQTIKNPATAAAKTLRRLETRHRLCLTGTPMENHLGDLWSLFDFLLPGFLGDARTFAREWRTPIEKKGDEHRRRLLARRVRPFLLRRTKGEVVTELPPKTEMIEHVEMAPAQRDLYEGIRLAMHGKIIEAMARKGLARSRIEFLDALLKLRQVCCDPRLMARRGAAGGQAPSAKLERLMEMLPELIEEGRRILLFSQFTTMLALIEAELASAGIPYVRLTGETRDRETPVRRFQGGDVPLFLISLKAGGTGLNLTAADTVIHYDPWWNPAVEAQATDRAHRIGQDKSVFIHKLITLDSIEEKMLDLQRRKRTLADGLFDPDAGSALDIGEDDVEYLLGAR